MQRYDTPRPARLLFAGSILLALLAGLALVTDQPVGVINLALGAGVGMNLATATMLGEVRRARRQGGSPLRDDLDR